MTLLQKPAALEHLSYEFESHKFQIAKKKNFFLLFYISLNNSLVWFLSHTKEYSI